MTGLRSDLMAQLLILERICVRGRSLFLEQGNSIGVDMFEHMETEVGRMMKMVEVNNDGSKLPE